MKKIIHHIPLFLAVLVCCIACEKIKYKDDFRAPLLGKYKCKVEVFSQTNRCLDKELIFEKKMNFGIHIIDNSVIEIRPSIMYSNGLENTGYDRLEYTGKYSWNINDSCYTFDNYSLHSYPEARYCVLSISPDSFSLYVLEACKYNYYISGKK